MTDFMRPEIILILVLSVAIIIYIFIIDPRINKQRIKNNNEYGSARFSTQKEIESNFTKESLTDLDKAGFPISFTKDLKYGYFDNTTPHWCFLGSSGSGKSVTSVIPQCAFFANSKVKRSVFITDPKGEIFSTTSKMFQDNGYKIITIDFRNPQLSSHFNILEPVIKEYEKYINLSKEADEIEEYLNNKESSSNKDKFIDKSDDELKARMTDCRNNSTSSLAETNRQIKSLADMIFAEKGNQDPFWNNSASNLLVGLIGFFLEEYKDGKIERSKITMTSIKKFQNSSMEDRNFKKLKRYIEAKPYGCTSKDSLTSIFSASENTYKSITAVFGAKMSIFDDVNVANVTSSSDFDFDILGKEPTALYVIVPDEDKTYFTLVTIIVGLLYKELVKLANSNPEKKLQVQIDWLLDEFANCPPLNDIEAIVSVARSRGMRFQFYIQSFSQLDNVYGKEVAQIILDNCGLVYLKTNTMDTARTISERLGKQTIESNSISQSAYIGILAGNQNQNANRSTSLMARDLMTPDEVMQLKFKTIIFPSVGYPIFRDTIFYKKFKCYQKGEIKRNTQLLRDLSDTYFTVEDIGKPIGQEKLEVDDKSISKVEKDLNQFQIDKLDQIFKIAEEELREIIKDQQLTFEIKSNSTKKFLSVKLEKPLSVQEKVQTINKLTENDKFEVNFDNGDGSSTTIEITVGNTLALDDAFGKRLRPFPLLEKNRELLLRSRRRPEET